MSDTNNIEHDQLTKVYDECLHYLKENHENFQTVIETDEPEYASVKDVSDIDTKSKNNIIFENNRVENNDDPNTSVAKHSNFTNVNETEKEYNTEINQEDNDVLYESLNHRMKIQNHLGDDKNKLAVIKYVPNDVLYEALNPNINYVKDMLKEDIQIVIKDDFEDDSHNINETKLDENTVKKNTLEYGPKLSKFTFKETNKSEFERPIVFKLENEVKSTESLSSLKSERLRKLSQQLPKIIITSTSSTTSLDPNLSGRRKMEPKHLLPRVDKLPVYNITRKSQLPRTRKAYGEFPKRLVSKTGLENVALISNVPFEKIRLLNDTFHTLINLRWRWIVIGTVVVHFLIWLVFALFWYITALAHYDFEPDPPKRSCVTGGKDFVTIFLASVEAQTTIGFGDRTIDEECPEAIFLFIMQLILGTGLSGVLTCVVYAKLTRPEKLSRDGVGFSKKAVISMRDGRLCLMIRAWDLNYDHIISSEFTVHFINTLKTKEGEIIRYYAQTLALQQRQFLLWPVTLVHVIDSSSPLFKYGPDVINRSSYEITVSLKGASASMGTFTQSQTSYVPKEIIWGHRFPPVVKYDCRKQKYVIDHKKLDVTEAVDTPYCSAEDMNKSIKETEMPIPVPSTPSSFSEKMSVFHLERTSSFRKKSKMS